MHKFPAWMVLIAGAWAASVASTENGPVPVSGPIESVGMFKNGLSLVHRTVEVPGPGRYRLAALPEPVHGTWWIDSDAEIVTRITRAAVDQPAAEIGDVDFQRDLAGSEVVVFFSDGSIPPVAGTVVQPDIATRQAWDRGYEGSRYGSGYFRLGATTSEQRPQESRFLVLQDGDKRSYIERGKIAYLQAASPRPTVRRYEPALVFEVDKAAVTPTVIHIGYLTKGLAWAPSYRVDLSDPRELVLRQKAVIRNELEDLQQAELVLISGYPSIQFSHVDSPLSPGATWATFFASLNQRLRPTQASGMAMSQALSNAAATPAGIDLATAPAGGEGVDLHYRSVGRHDLAAGDALSLDVARATAPYDRIVEWIIPDTRTPDGRPMDDRRYDRDIEEIDDSPWDAVRFENPLPYPMTTGAAMVVDQGRFNGQRMSYWANSGDETTLRITKALSLRTSHSEVEEEGERETLQLSGRRFYRAHVRGELSVANRRAAGLDLVIRRRFSGELVAADGEPRERLLESGVYSDNRRNELTWTLHLDPGQEATREYRYDVLVRF